MLLKRFYDESLAQASYLVGCAATGEALVVDANRDVEQYELAAQAERLRITHVTEAHIHADYVSGSRELASRTNARLLLSAEGGEDWQYGFAESDGATLLGDGDVFMVGNVRVEAVHTPGHTPEHLVFVITDTAGADEPMGALTGDFIFVGDVGRPDLLERAARIEGTMDQAARALFRSLEAFRSRPDYLQLWPGHGAGSACGKALGAVPQTTLGYERRFNWAFGIRDEEEFVRQVLAGQPAPPTYFAQMKRINRDGPLVRTGGAEPRRLDAPALERALAGPAVVVDVRRAADYGELHAPGTINIPYNKAFTGWAGWLLPYDQDVILVGDDEATLAQARRALALIGLDRVPGVALAATANTLAGDPSSVAIPTVSGDELRQALRGGDIVALDVRNRSEYEAGHLPGVVNIPLGELPQRLHEVPNGKPLVVHCESGSRSAIAASVLQARAGRDVRNYAGGFAEWSRSGAPVER
jgi:hydroxyacylglutathione hydrolase